MRACKYRCHVSYLIFESDTCEHLLTQKDKVEYDKKLVIYCPHRHFQHTKHKAEVSTGLPTSS